MAPRLERASAESGCSVRYSRKLRSARARSPASKARRPPSSEFCGTAASQSPKNISRTIPISISGAATVKPAPSSRDLEIELRRELDPARIGGAGEGAESEASARAAQHSRCVDQLSRCIELRAG